MRKIFIALMTICISGIFSVAQAANPIQFKIKQPMPSGLAKGTFTIKLINKYASINDINTPVTNYKYDLISEISFLNDQIANGTYNGEPIYNFPTQVIITLTCHNKAAVTYNYGTDQVKSSGKVELGAPANCH